MSSKSQQIIYLILIIEFESLRLMPDLLRDLRNGFRLDQSTKFKPTVTSAYGDPDLIDDETTTVSPVTTTTAKNWFWKLVSLF